MTDDIRCAGVLVRTDHRAQFRDVRLSPDGIGLAIHSRQRSDKAMLWTPTFTLSPRIPPERPATLDSIMAIFGRISTLESTGAGCFFLVVFEPLDLRIPIERLAIMEPGQTCLTERLAHGYHRSDWPPWTPSWPPSRLEGFPPAEGSCFCCVCASGSSVDGQLAQKSVGLFLRRQVVLHASAKGRRTTAFSGLVDTGDLYLGGGNPFRTLAHSARGQVPQGFNQRSCHSNGRPVCSLPASCAIEPLE
ncbi:hypothetical protein B0H13DRAFT_331172 [Mycena leptocephala]|nr:hypothetical protein B0H13DRAFT_331172 [Mycena leptocephala]